MHEAIDVSIPPHNLAGELVLPDGHRSIVLFAHGSGSSRRSPRNRKVAMALADAGFGALLVDLLTESEAEDRVNAFDIDLLADRLTSAVDWIANQPRYRDIRIGLFGSSTGAAAALKTAARRPNKVSCIVSRGGRPDLAGSELQSVKAPTLLIVGSADGPVLRLTDQALRNLSCPTRLAIVPNATHLFEEPGAMETVVRLAVDWFSEH
jgi:dipeptidyl aminopeptidase/acylaminoacyl peptidase